MISELILNINNFPGGGFEIQIGINFRKVQFAARIISKVKFFQVMQFGRIDANAYTLDFQYPLTAIQAFSVALANVTQRLK